MDDAKINSLNEIIALMDGHMMKGYQSKLPKKQSMDLDTNMSTEPEGEEAPEQSPAELFEGAKGEGGEEMDDATMQELMKLYEEEGSDEPADVNGLS